MDSVTLSGATRDTANLSGASKTGGTITFEVFGPNDNACSGPVVFTTHEDVVGNGTYTSAHFTPQRPGTYHWVAAYSGDANNNSVATGCGEDRESTVVLRHQPTLTSSASPPADLRTGSRVQAAGLPIYDSARLSDGLDPTGQITFDLYGPNNSTCSGPPVFTSAAIVDGNGIYNSESFTPTASGTYRWVDTYSGDERDNRAGPTDCRDSNEHVRVTLPADPSLVTSASDAVTLGGPIHDTAALSAGSSPTATITFRVYSPSDSTCTSHVVFTSTVGVNGNGDYTSGSYVPTAAGAYRWVARDSGDAANNPVGTSCGDAGETAVVRPRDITPATPAFSTMTPRSPGLETPIYDTAHLNGGIDPRGAVTFTLFGPDDPSCSGPPAFTTIVAVTGNGDYRSASFVVSRAGTYRWVARYAGDAMIAAVNSACGDPPETVTLSPGVGPSPDPPIGPNVPTPAKPKPPLKPKAPSKPTPPPKPKPPKPLPPAFTG